MSFYHSKCCFGILFVLVILNVFFILSEAKNLLPSSCEPLRLPEFLFFSREKSSRIVEAFFAIGIQNDYECDLV